MQYARNRYSVYRETTGCWTARFRFLFYCVYKRRETNVTLLQNIRPFTPSEDTDGHFLYARKTVILWITDIRNCSRIHGTNLLRDLTIKEIVVAPALSLLSECAMIIYVPGVFSFPFGQCNNPTAMKSLQSKDSNEDNYNFTRRKNYCIEIESFSVFGNLWTYRGFWEFS